MLTIVRKVIYYLVAVALRAWQQELINRLELKDSKRKEVKNVENAKETAEKSK